MSSRLQSIRFSLCSIMYEKQILIKIVKTMFVCYANRRRGSPWNTNQTPSHYGHNAWALIVISTRVSKPNMVANEHGLYTCCVDSLWVLSFSFLKRLHINSGYHSPLLASTPSCATTLSSPYSASRLFQQQLKSHMTLIWYTQKCLLFFKVHLPK